MGEDCWSGGRRVEPAGDRRTRRRSQQVVWTGIDDEVGALMEIVIRAAVAFFIPWLVTRAAGRATLGELSSFDLLLFVTMGDLIQQGITMNDTSLVGGVLAVGTIAVLSVAMGYAGARWPKFRSEERRVGKEGRGRGWRWEAKKRRERREGW